MIVSAVAFAVPSAALAWGVLGRDPRDFKPALGLVSTTFRSTWGSVRKRLKLRRNGRRR